MMRVISSPSSSATGFSTLIFGISKVPQGSVARWIVGPYSIGVKGGKALLSPKPWAAGRTHDPTDLKEDQRDDYAARARQDGRFPREKAMLAFVGFLLTALAGRWGHGVDLAARLGLAEPGREGRQGHPERARPPIRAHPISINTRWHAIYRMVRAIERGAGDDEWKDARAEFSASDKDWAVHYTSVARDVAFYVDTPFTVEAKDKMKPVWPLPCNAYALGGSGGIDPSRARLPSRRWSPIARGWWGTRSTRPSTPIWSAPAQTRRGRAKGLRRSRRHAARRDLQDQRGAPLHHFHARLDHPPEPAGELPFGFVPRPRAAGICATGREGLFGLTGGGRPQHRFYAWPSVSISIRF